MAVDVVVVNYKTPQLLREFVASYADARFADCTLTVVDVESRGYTAVGTWDYYMNMEENCGYGKACNEGAKNGHNDVILLANADTVLSSGFKECYDALMSHPEWAVLGPRQVNAGDQITAGGTFGPNNHMYHRGWRQVDGGEFSDINDAATTVSGSLYFIKRRVWNELTYCPRNPNDNGAFLETPHYYDETWCSLHARAHGYRCVYYGPVKMTHYWHAASPVGGWAEQQWGASLALYRQACLRHSIECE